MSKIKYYLREWIFPLVIAIVLVYGTYFSLSKILNNNYPIVTVVSSSMEHKNDVYQKFYKYFFDLGYSNEQINKFPVKLGISIGDVLIVKKEEKYNVGDVIVFKPVCEQAPIVHRIVKINEDGTYQTKGDNNDRQLVKICYTEEKINKEIIEGKVVFIIPKIGILRYLVYNIFKI